MNYTCFSSTIRNSFSVLSSFSRPPADGGVQSLLRVFQFPESKNLSTVLPWHDYRGLRRDDVSCFSFQPWQSEEEGSWLREYPVTLMQFFRYLYHNVPDLGPMWHSPEFLCALAATVFPFNIRPYSEMVSLEVLFFTVKETFRKKNNFFCFFFWSLLLINYFYFKPKCLKYVY